MNDLDLIDIELKNFIAELKTSVSDKSEIKELLKGWRIFYSSKKKDADILFIGINPGAGELDDPFLFDDDINEDTIFHYVDNVNNKYSLARNTKAIFNEMNLINFLGSNSVKVNSKFYATKDLSSMLAFEQLLYNEHRDLYDKLMYLNKDWITRIIRYINPKVIICEGIKSFYYVDNVIYGESEGWEEVLRYEENKICGYYRRNDGQILFGYSRSPKYFNIKYIAKHLKTVLKDN